MPAKEPSMPRHEAEKRCKGDYLVWHGPSSGNFHLGAQTMYGFTAHIPTDAIRGATETQTSKGEASSQPEASSSQATQGCDVAMECGSAPNRTSSIPTVCSEIPHKDQENPSADHGKPTETSSTPMVGGEKALGTSMDEDGMTMPPCDGRTLETVNTSALRPSQDQEKLTCHAADRPKRPSKIRRPIPVKLTPDVVRKMGRRLLQVKATNRYLTKHAKNHKLVQYERSSDGLPLVFLHPATTRNIARGKPRQASLEKDGFVSVSKSTSAKETVDGDVKGNDIEVEPPVLPPMPSVLASKAPKPSLPHPASNSALRKILQNPTTAVPCHVTPSSVVNPIPATSAATTTCPASQQGATNMQIPQVASTGAHSSFLVPVHVQGQGQAQRRFMPVAPPMAGMAPTSVPNAGPRLPPRAGFVQPYPMQTLFIPHTAPRQQPPPPPPPSQPRVLSRAEWIREQILPSEPPLRARRRLYDSVLHPATNIAATAATNPGLTQQIVHPPHIAPVMMGPGLGQGLPIASHPNTFTSAQLPHQEPVGPSRERNERPSESSVPQLPPLLFSPGHSVSVKKADDHLSNFMSAANDLLKSSRDQARSFPATDEDPSRGIGIVRGAMEDQPESDNPGRAYAFSPPGHGMHASSSPSRSRLHRSWLRSKDAAMKKQYSQLLQNLGWHTMQLLIQKSQEAKSAREAQELADSEPPPLISRRASDS